MINTMDELLSLYLSCSICLFTVKFEALLILLPLLFIYVLDVCE